MDSKASQMAADAEIKIDNVNVILSKQIGRLQIKSVLDDLTVEQYKSIFFILMDYVHEEFLNIVKQEKTYMRQKLEEILKEINNDSIIIELFGTMKMYRKLRVLGSCCHVYKKFQQKKFNNINGVWKMFYALCEELNNINLEILKQFFPEEKIEVAEEWFFLALQNTLISKTDFSTLEQILLNYPSCLNIIRDFEKPKSYDIRTPTANIHCGIAVILNFEKFDKNFEEREGSDIDVNSLKNVWNKFGFKTEVYNNLTKTETLTKLKYYADLDQSNYDAFVCCILSHGLSNSVISSDGEEMPIPYLIDVIASKCSSLDSKPKLFFIQACQGIRIKQGFGQPVYNPDSPQTTVSLRIPAIMSDVLLAIASIDGFVSFREPKTGSWFIQAFCSVMKQKGDKFSILDIMTEVNNTVREKQIYCRAGKIQQIVNCYNTFGKVLILKKRTGGSSFLN